jgi:predicted 3-demethylubiquinone-9 3-methyltransferase (glyoxalase superfamily)
MQKITPFIWLNGKAYEAAKFYTSIFPNSKILSNLESGEESISIINIMLNGTEYMLFNGDGSTEFEFTESISFFVSCENQLEVDTYWNALTSDGGSEVQCGWLRDKYGISWQIIPNALGTLMGDPDRVKSTRVMNAMLKMKKIIVSELEDAYKGL